jgi:hypothetical protein
MVSWVVGLHHRRVLAIAACSLLVLAGASYAATRLSASPAGTKRSPDHAVRLAEPRAAVPSCMDVPGAYPPVELYTERRSSALLGITSVGTWGASHCRLQERLSVVVKRWTGVVSTEGVVGGVERSPAAVDVNVQLRPGAVIVSEWQWRNWCGKSGRFQLQASWGVLPAPSGSVKPPACRSRREPSTLRLVPVQVPMCKTTDYRFRPGIGQVFLGTIISAISISLLSGRSPCVLRTTVRFALQHETGRRWTTLRQIEGNPGEQRTGAVLAPGQPIQLFWAWANWCGAASARFRAVGQIDHRTSVGRTSSSRPGSRLPPTCVSPGSRSELAPSYGH